MQSNSIESRIITVSTKGNMVFIIQQNIIERRLRAIIEGKKGDYVIH